MTRSNRRNSPHQKACPPECQCMCHEFGITAEHGNLDHCPTKDGLPLTDAEWVTETAPIT